MTALSVERGAMSPFSQRMGLALFALAYLLFAALTTADFVNPQVVTRLGLAVSIVEEQTLSIDRFADQTSDKAFVNEHYYSDKAPGLSLIALPSVALLHAFIGDFGATTLPAYVRVATWATSVFGGAIAVLLAYFASLRLGATQRQALLAAFVLGMATPFMGWSTVLFAHAVSGTLLMAAATILLFEFTGRAQSPEWRLGLIVGFLLGFTLVVDVVAAPAVVILGLLALWLAWRRNLKYAVRLCLFLAAGGIAGLLPLFVYNTLAFGSPFVMGYSNVVGFDGMKRGFFGLTTFSLWKALALTFGLYRGLLPLAPVLLLVPFGLWRMWRIGGAARVAGIVITAVFFAFLFMNASYFYWDGGWSTGPRHMIPTLPFLAVAMAFAWPKHRIGQIVAFMLLAASAVFSLACAVTTMYATDVSQAPLFEMILPRLLEQQPTDRALPGVFAWIAFAYFWYRAGLVDKASAKA